MKELTIELDNPVNPDLLMEELQSLLGDKVLSLGCGPTRTIVYVKDETDEDLADMIEAAVKAHDRTKLTDRQQKIKTGADARLSILSAIDKKVAYYQDVAVNPALHTDIIETMAKDMVELYTALEHVLSSHKT